MILDLFYMRGPTNSCVELGHVRKHCKEEQAERETAAPVIKCVYCQEEGHRARDCPQERVNRFACKNCKQEGHNAVCLRRFHRFPSFTNSLFRRSAPNLVPLRVSSAVAAIRWDISRYVL